MPLQYVRLNNDTIIIKTSQGFVTRNRRSFNFNRISKLVREGVEEDQILPLLETPELVDGIYEVYVQPLEHVLCVKHLRKTSDDSYEWFGNTEGSKLVFVYGEIDRYFEGVYASMEDVKLDWPEYII